MDMEPHLVEDTDIHLDSVRAMAAEVNIPSDFFPTESYLIDHIITSNPQCAAMGVILGIKQLI